VPNVSGARLLVLRADRLAKDLSDHPQNVEQRRALADGNIADRSRGGLRRIAGEQVCLHGVIDEGEIADCRPSPKIVGGLPARAAPMKFGMTAAYWDVGSWRGPKTLK